MKAKPKSIAKAGARKEAICAAFKDGETVPEIARRMGETRQVVYHHLKLAGLIKPNTHTQREEVAHVIVDRDPCPWCATRRDIGCRHTRADIT